MITDQDVTKLKTIFATKKELNGGLKELDEKIDRVIEQMATKDDLNEVKEKVEENSKAVHRILTIVEKLADPIQTIRTEYSAVSAQLERHDKWIKTLADETNIKLAVE